MKSFTFYATQGEGGALKFLTLHIEISDLQNIFFTEVGGLQFLWYYGKCE